MRRSTLPVLVCFALACGSPVLRVGTSGDYAPFSLDGEGFDVEVAQRLAADLGMRLEWVRFRWPDLARAVAANEFDIAMSGVTWRPDRAVVGWMTRAVAVGGPCVVGAPDAERIGVNAGGFLERWARRRFPDAEIVTTGDNPSLPARLEQGEVQAIVTDSFELPHFVSEEDGEDDGEGEGDGEGDDVPVDCAPPVHRKVYWVAPARAASLGPRIDAWLRANEPELRGLRERWLGDAGPRGRADHVADLVGRRFAFMPAVAAYKRARGIPIEDLEREARVLEGVRAHATAVGLAPEPVAAAFRVMIDLAKRVQARAPGPAEELDLATRLRPALSLLGERLIGALVEVGGSEDPFPPGRLALAGVLLEPPEREALRVALRAAAAGTR